MHTSSDDCRIPFSKTTDEIDSSRWSCHNPLNSHCTSHLSFADSCSSMKVSSIEQRLMSLNFDDRSANPIPDQQDSKVGVRSIAIGSRHCLLVTYSGEVYGWGDNCWGQVLYSGPRSITSPVKLPLYNIVTISAGHEFSLALTSEGKLFGWGSNQFNQIIMSIDHYLPVTRIHIPYNIKEIYGAIVHSVALTCEGKVIFWGNHKTIQFIEELNNIVFIFVNGFCFIAIDENCQFYMIHHDIDEGAITTKLPISQHVSIIDPLQCSFAFNGDQLYLEDFYTDVWLFDTSGVCGDVPFDVEPIKVEGLSNIVSISGSFGIYAAIDYDGQVFVWGDLQTLCGVYKDFNEPMSVTAFTNVGGISVGHDFLFAYNKNTVWAWGRNDRGQLGTGDLIDRPQPVKVFGSEILGSFDYPNKPMNTMFSTLVKLIYFEYLQLLKNLSSNRPYTKARFHTKSSISKRVIEFAKEVINGLTFLEDPQDLDLNENICDLQLRFSTDYKGPRVINTRIKKLDVYYNEVDYDPELLTFFPNVEVVKLGGWEGSGARSLNFAHLSNLKCLELSCPFNIEQLPTSLVKLVISYFFMKVTDFSYLASLQVMEIMDLWVSEKIPKGELPLPQCIVRLELHITSPIHFKVQLPNLKELVFESGVPGNITEQNFPSLKFVKLIRPDEDSLSNSTLSPTKLINQGIIESVQLIKNEYLVELSCFPWWIQYSAEREMFGVFRGFVREDKEILQ
ncbi:hypothetical protein P9112_000698 [Eukaryota sp. TZLM1-RC]